MAYAVLPLYGEPPHKARQIGVATSFFRFAYFFKIFYYFFDKQGSEKLYIEPSKSPYYNKAKAEKVQYSSVFLHIGLKMG